MAVMAHFVCSKGAARVFINVGQESGWHGDGGGVFGLLCRYVCKYVKGFMWWACYMQMTQSKRMIELERLKKW